MAPKSPRNLDRKIAGFTRLAWTFVIIGAGAGAYGVWAFWGNRAGTNLANLGSYLQGSVGSLWALAGFLFIYVAFLGQRHQMIRQEEELQRQERRFQIQNFENSFFQILNFQNSIVSTIKSGRGDGNDGRACFKLCLHDLNRQFAGGQIGNEVIEENIRKCAQRIFEEYEESLTHYFRNLYHLIKFVDQSEIPASDKKRYASLVRAQLSSFELALLFYNGITPVGQEKFQPLIEKYGLLANLDKKLLFDKSHETLYAKEAFD